MTGRAVSEADREPEVQVARLGAIAQIGIVTGDLERAIRAWSDRYGVGPWRIREFGPENVADQVPDPFSMRLATARVGTVDLELIQPLDEASDYARSLRRHHGADHMHHMLFRTADFAAAIDGFARAGVEQAMAGTTDGSRFIYFDTERELGTRIELLGPADRLRPES
jgi:methylmalonyl-CoA/ethylmalonyl-CoA epimerase